MSSHMVFQGVDDPIKSRLESYWQKKSPRLEKLLTNYRPDLVEMLLRPLLGFLSDHARREIHSLERSGLLHRGEVEVADVPGEDIESARQALRERRAAGEPAAEKSGK